MELNHKSRYFFLVENWPSIEKNIIKPAEIWMTLRLPTRVLPRSPTFSLTSTLKRSVFLYPLRSESYRLRKTLTRRLLNRSVFQKGHLTRFRFPANRYHGSEHEQEVVWHLLGAMQLYMPQWTVKEKIIFLHHRSTMYFSMCIAYNCKLCKYDMSLPQSMRLKQQPSFEKRGQHQM